MEVGFGFGLCRSSAELRSKSPERCTLARYAEREGRGDILGVGSGVPSGKEGRVEVRRFLTEGGVLVPSVSLPESLEEAESIFEPLEGESRVEEVSTERVGNCRGGGERVVVPGLGADFDDASSVYSDEVIVVEE